MVGPIRVPASLVSSFVNLNNFRNRYESFANIMERHHPASLVHYLSKKQIHDRKRRQVARKKEKDLYISGCLEGRIPLERVPKYLRYQVRGILDEATSGPTEQAQKRVVIPCEGYEVMGSIDGLVDLEGEKHVCEYKSRTRYWVLPIRDRIQTTCYAIALGLPAVLRQQLGQETKDTTWTLEECKRFWSDILPVLDESVQEFREVLEGTLPPKRQMLVRFWLKNSNH